jgi:uncharacterized membrane protein YqjE
MSHGTGFLASYSSFEAVIAGLALAAVLLLIIVGMAVIFRFRVVKPFFPTTLAEFQKDREWLKHSTKSSK